MPQKDPCQKQACAIQKCLQANNYNESRCEDVIRAMQKCCDFHKEKTSVCCSGFTKERRKHNSEDKTNQTMQSRK